jgi:hypothetical protein
MDQSGLCRAVCLVPLGGSLAAPAAAREERDRRRRRDCCDCGAWCATTPGALTWKEYGLIQVGRRQRRRWASSALTGGSRAARGRTTRWQLRRLTDQKARPDLRIARVWGGARVGRLALTHYERTPDLEPAPYPWRRRKLGEVTTNERDHHRDSTDRSTARKPSHASHWRRSSAAAPSPHENQNVKELTPCEARTTEVSGTPVVLA